VTYNVAFNVCMWNKFEITIYEDPRQNIDIRTHLATAEQKVKLAIKSMKFIKKTPNKDRSKPKGAMTFILTHERFLYTLCYQQIQP